jgi:peptidoglycan lytic transglycosylase G
MKTLLRLFLLLFVVGLIGAGASTWWVQRWLGLPLAHLQSPQVFEVPRGANLRSVATSLEQRGVLDQALAWQLWARATHQANVLKAGEYQLTPGLTPRGLLELLRSGNVILHSITFIEGSTFRDLRKLLNSNDAIKATVFEKTDEELMTALGEPGVHPEGQFFPDTYRFPRGTSDLEILKLAHTRLRSELDAAWNARIPDLPLASPYEALILASIVEKESALPQERPLIAGVFVERLRRGMRLQTDPTVIYGMLDTYAGNIRKVDLLRDTPYNTYTRPGLPPTPISLPGLGSLQAATRPELSGALFFVATGEPDGSHCFSKTLNEHDAAVKRYLQKLKQRS